MNKQDTEKKNGWCSIAQTSNKYADYYLEQHKGTLSMHPSNNLS